MKNSDYEIDEKDKNILLSSEGINNVEKNFSNRILKNNNFYDPENLSLVHHVNQALGQIIYSKKEGLHSQR